MLCPVELGRLYNAGRVIPFIGAGISMSVCWHDGKTERRGPSWGELVEQATSQLGFSSPELARAKGTEQQILEYFKLKNNGQIAKLTNWLSREMMPPDDALKDSAIHAELSKLERCNLFYTTNYDDFIERAFRLNGRNCNALAVETHMAVEAGICQVVKFHGDLNYPDQIVLTESDYEKRLKLSTHLDYRLRADLLGRVILFIGYSFRDPNVSYLFRLFTEQFKNSPGSLAGPRAFIAVSDPSDFEMELFQERKINVIQIDGLQQTTQVAQLLDEMRTY